MSHTHSPDSPIYHPATPANRRQPKSQATLPAQHYTTTSMTLTQAKALQADLRHVSSQVSQLPSPFTPDEKIFITDTGASITITNDAIDFVSPPKAVQHTELKGIDAGLTVQGIGMARYSFRSDDGHSFTLTLPNVLLVPKIPVRLLCPRHVAKITQHEGDGFNSTHPTGIFTCHGHKINVRYHRQTGLPVIQLAPGIDRYLGFLSSKLSTNPSTSQPPRHTGNLSPAQRAKLILHERCNHINMEQLNAWICQGHFSIDPSIATAPNPICRACQFGKARCMEHTQDAGSITDRHNYPGAGVSSDQMEAGYPGRMLTTKGQPSPQRYKFCNFWVDHHSRYIFPTLHVMKVATEMLRSKQCFKDFARRYNVSIRSIQADNGLYASTVFQQSCTAQKQNLTFCAVGSRHACAFHNASIHPDTNQSPHCMFTGEEAPWKLEHFRVFRSPVFILAKKLQDGDTIQK